MRDRRGVGKPWCTECHGINAPREGSASHEVPEHDHGRGRNDKDKNTAIAHARASTAGKQGRNVPAKPR